MIVIFGSSPKEKNEAKGKTGTVKSTNCQQKIYTST